MKYLLILFALGLFAFSTNEVEPKVYQTEDGTVFVKADSDISAEELTEAITKAKKEGTIISVTSDSMTYPTCFAYNDADCGNCHDGGKYCPCTDSQGDILWLEVRCSGTPGEGGPNPN